MGYRASEDDQDTASGLRKGLTWVAGIAAFFIAKAVVGGLMHDGSSGRFQTDAQIKARSEQAIGANPAQSVVFGALKRDFPERYDAFLNLIVNEVRTGKTEAEARADGFAFMRRTVKENTPNLRSAPTENLMQIAHLQSAVSVSLQGSSSVNCAHFANEGLQVYDSIAPDGAALLAQLSAAILHAARKGIDHATAKRPETLNEQDAQKFALAISRQSLNTRQLDAFQSGKMNSLTPGDQCEIGVAVYKAITQLPAETMANVTATLMAP